MQHTLVAVFGDRADAQNAMNALISSGFPREEVTLSNADPTGMTDSTPGQAAGATRAGAAGLGTGASLKRVFTDLFGADNSPRASRYAGAVTRGHHVLVVRAASLAQAERAADIVERFGPSDIDDEPLQAGAIGLDTDRPPASMRTGDPGSMQQAAAPAHSGPRPGPRPHLDNPGDGMIFQQHSLYQSQPTGGTYQEPLGESGLGATGSTSLHGSTLRENAAHVPSFEDLEAGPGGEARQRDTPMNTAPLGSSGLAETQRGRSRIYSPEPAPSGGGLDIGSNFFGDDDDYYRNHFLSNYGGEDYERLKPAYAYGADMARHDKYQGRAWHEVESDLRSAWEARSAGMHGLGWDSIKAAVRRGWDRMTVHHDADNYYRSHYDTHLADSGMDYDSVKSAYSYGAEMRRSELYRNRPWDDAEGDLARAWHMEGAWERLKAAVRHGWERITADEDERAYRSHWDATFGSASHAGSYAEYKPAYAFGAAMAHDSRYLGRRWDEVEEALRGDWDARHGSGGQSRWEMIKPAVQHGWDRARA
ncbi:hypothetical protein [Massilia sp.]|uniref:hypothetical protein n=1 Tax=Massilia sp. TaxID=1882437 RepID=UPI003918DEF9